MTGPDGGQGHDRWDFEAAELTAAALAVDFLRSFTECEHWHPALLDGELVVYAPVDALLEAVAEQMERYRREMGEP